MLDVILETLRSVVMVGIFASFLRIGRRGKLADQPGWSFVLVGFALMAFGSVVDITDNFESLNKFVVIGDTTAEAYAEKVVGFLFGSVALAIGFSSWLPRVEATVQDLDQSRGDLHVAEARFRSGRDRRSLCPRLRRSCPQSEMVMGRPT